MSNKLEYIFEKEAKPIVLILTGPCGSGKTTIANLIAHNSNFIHIIGDNIHMELFPEIKNIAYYPEALEKFISRFFKEQKSILKMARTS